MDGWNSDIATLQGDIDQIEGYIRQRQETAMMGKSTSVVDDTIKSKLRILNINFQNLERKVQDYEAGIGGNNLYVLCIIPLVRLERRTSASFD